MEPEIPLKATALRGILKYVPLFRGETFVIAVDGSVVADAGFRSLLTDLAVLHSLNIRLVLVHGVGQQIRTLSTERDLPITDAYGDGPTDEATLQLALDAGGQVLAALQAGFTERGIPCALPNAVRLTERGIIRGTDYQRSGRVEKVEGALLSQLLAAGTTPILSPVAADRSGRLLRANADEVAAAVATKLGASKLIFLTSHTGLVVHGERLTNLPVDQLEPLLAGEATGMEPQVQGKARAALVALRGGTPRVHILDGRVRGGLLTEIFDKVGLGTMIHSNDYEQIRPAGPADAEAILQLVREGMRGDALRARGAEELAGEIADYFLYEIDGGLVACAALHPQADGRSAELASVFVHPSYQGRGIGSRLVGFAEKRASELGLDRLYALSTQSSPFFREACGFTETDAATLPEPLRGLHATACRGSRVLTKSLFPS